MIATIAYYVPFLVLASHVGLAVLFVSLVMKNDFARWVGKHALALGFLIAFVAVLGSLFYSNGVGFTPCYLCWWQRIFIYPMLVLFIVALVKKDRGVFSYILPLALLDLLFASYHSYVQWGGNPLIPCDATASCAKLYVYAFHYITIPTMSLTVALAVLLVYWANRVYEHRHA